MLLILRGQLYVVDDCIRGRKNKKKLKKGTLWTLFHPRLDIPLRAKEIVRNKSALSSLFLSLSRLSLFPLRARVCNFNPCNSSVIFFSPPQ